jgi:hypothetical protein
MFHKNNGHHWGKGGPHGCTFGVFIANPFKGKEGKRETNFDKVKSFEVY